LAVLAVHPIHRSFAPISRAAQLPRDLRIPLRHLARHNTTVTEPGKIPNEALEDVFWTMLNSKEFFFKY